MKAMSAGEGDQVIESSSTKGRAYHASLLLSKHAHILACPPSFSLALSSIFQAPAHQTTQRRCPGCEKRYRNNRGKREAH